MIRIFPEMHRGVELIAREMNCTLQEVTYRLLLRGMEWFLKGVRTRGGADRIAEWVRDPGAQPYRSAPRKQSPLRCRDITSSTSSKRDVSNEQAPLPEDYFPGDL